MAAVKISKEIFISAYPAKKKSLQIYFKKGRAECCDRSQKVKNLASLSHRLYDLREHIRNAEHKNEKKQLAGIAHKMYDQEHKDYGCLRKILYCFNNLRHGRGFHDEAYFLDKIDEIAPTPQKMRIMFADKNDLKTKKDRESFAAMIGTLSPKEIKEWAKEHKSPFNFNVNTYTPMPIDNDDAVADKMEYIFQSLSIKQLTALIEGVFAKDVEDGSFSERAFVNILIGIRASKDPMKLTIALMKATKTAKEYVDLGVTCVARGKKGKDYLAAVDFIRNYTTTVLKLSKKQRDVNERLEKLWNDCTIMSAALSVERMPPNMSKKGTVINLGHIIKNSYYSEELDPSLQPKFKAWVDYMERKYPYLKDAKLREQMLG